MKLTIIGSAFISMVVFSLSTIADAHGGCSWCWRWSKYRFRNFSRGFYFRETSHMRSFVKIKSSRNGEITLSFTDICKSCLSRKIFNGTDMSFNAIRKNKILAKIFEFAVYIEDLTLVLMFY